MILYLGNRDAYNLENVAVLDDDGEPTVVERRVPVVGKLRCTVEFPDGIDLREAFLTVTDPGQGVWVSQTNGDAPPAWVASDDDALATILAAHYGCEKRDPLPTGERGEHAVEA